MEGPLSKWTNVMKGWQYRWFVLDYNAGLLSYYTVSRFQRWQTHGSLAGHLICRFFLKPQVRWCGPAVCQELGVSAGSSGRFWEDGFLRWPIATLLSHWLANWLYRVHTSANLAYWLASDCSQKKEYIHRCLFSMKTGCGVRQTTKELCMSAT